MYRCARLDEGQVDEIFEECSDHSYAHERHFNETPGSCPVPVHTPPRMTSVGTPMRPQFGQSGVFMVSASASVASLADKPHHHLTIVSLESHRIIGGWPCLRAHDCRSQTPHTAPAVLAQQVSGSEA
jgi:hypothetical protein